MQFRVSPEVVGQRRSHQVLPCRQRHAQRQLHARARGRAAHPVAQQALVVRHRGQRVAQQRARVGELQLLFAVGEQRHAVIALEVRDVLRHRRLRDVQLLSGARVVHRSANGQKRFDTEIQHCDLYQDKQ